MTDDQRITDLANRVDRIETDLWAELRQISATLTKLEVSAARNHCPAPGKCIWLESALSSSVLRIEKLELRMIDMDQWRFRMIGGLGVLMIALTVFAPFIRKLLRLE